MIPRSLSLAPCLLAATAGTAAQAHVVFAEPAATAGAYYAGFLRVSHGCAGSPTVAIRVTIPAGIAIARPQPKPGWTLSVEREPLATPVRGEGGQMMRDRVASITWSGRLETDQFDQFGMMLKLPDAPGTLYFPTVQRCETGSTAWTTIPAPGQAWHAVKTPAPVLDVTATRSDAIGSMKM